MPASAARQLPSHPRAQRSRHADPERRTRHDRRRHFQLRRRDLLVDALLALALCLILVSQTAGLAVVALLEVPIGVGLVVSLLIERRRRRSVAIHERDRGAQAGRRAQRRDPAPRLHGRLRG